MATAPSNISGYVSRHGDGGPSLEYHYSDDVAFAWSGSLADPIEVSFGSHGAAVDHLIDVRGAVVAPSDLGDALTWFAQVCEEWLTWLGHCEAGDVATWTEFDTAGSASRQHRIDTGVYLLRAVATDAAGSRS